MVDPHDNFAGAFWLFDDLRICIRNRTIYLYIILKNLQHRILQIQNHQPLRFVEIIYYTACSLDPSEIFIRAKMTSVREASKGGDGRILANLRELPAVCRPMADEVILRLGEVGLGGLLLMGNTSEAVFEIPVELNKIGMILLGGLNPVAAAEEAGIEAENHAMSTIMEYQDLIKVEEVV